MLVKSGKLILLALLVYLLYLILFGIVPYALPKSVGMEAKEKLDVNRFYGQEGVYGPDRIALLENSEDSFHQRLRLVSQAQQTLDISYHCIDWGVTSEYFVGGILEAADRGVKVRLILDGKVHGLGNGEAKNAAYALAGHPNIEFVEYNPLHLLKPWQWNTLLHDKFIICDNKYMILGGRNIGDKYFDTLGFDGAVSQDRDVLVFNTAAGAPAGASSALLQTRDYLDYLWAAPITEPAYHQLSAKQLNQGARAQKRLLEQYQQLKATLPELFDPAAYDFYSQTVPTYKITLIYNPVNSSKKEPWVGWQLAEFAKQAQQSVTIQSPYVVAGSKMIDAFQEVGSQVEDFTLLTNSAASTPNLPAFSHYFAKKQAILDTGVTVYEYQSTNSIHGKSCLMDERFSAVGSFNMDDRSLYIDTETMLIVDSPEFYQVLKGAIDELKGQSLVVAEAGAYHANEQVEELPVSTSKKAMLHVASVFSRMLRFLI